MRILRFFLMIIFCIAIIIFSSSLIRDFMQKDSSIPVIQSETDVIEISCDYSDEQLLQGLVAMDEKEGDLTNQIIVGNMSRFIKKGECRVTYVVFDSSYQTASLTRKVRFTDYYSPRIYASRSLTFRETIGSATQIQEALSVKDALDGDLTGSVIVEESTVNYSVQGDYTCTLKVTNRYGDTRILEVPVHIIGQQKTLDIQLKQGIIYLNIGDKLNPYDYINQIVNSKGNYLSNRSVSVDSNVDVKTPGLYEVHYTISSGGETGESWLTVVVE